jgi:hypothetical protein
VTVLDQITRPLSWLRIRNQHTATVAQKASTTIPTSIKGKHALRPAQPVQITKNSIKLPCRMNAACYQEVLAVVLEVHSAKKHEAKGQELVLDLSDVKQLDLTGIFALHCIVMMMRGETVSNPANGWSTLRTVAERNLAADRQENLKVYNPSAPIEALLRANYFDRVLIIESQNNPNQRLP